MIGKELNFRPRIERETGFEPATLSPLCYPSRIFDLARRCCGILMECALRSNHGRLTATLFEGRTESESVVTYLLIALSHQRFRAEVDRYDRRHLSQHVHRLRGQTHAPIALLRMRLPFSNRANEPQGSSCSRIGYPSGRIPSAYEEKPPAPLRLIR